MSILVLQSSLFVRKNLLLCLVCLPCDSYVALPHGAPGMSAACDCGIFDIF